MWILDSGKVKELSPKILRLITFIIQFFIFSLLIQDVDLEFVSKYWWKFVGYRFVYILFHKTVPKSGMHWTFIKWALYNYEKKIRKHCKDSTEVLTLWVQILRNFLKNRFSRCMLYIWAQCRDWYRLKPVFLR